MPISAPSVIASQTVTVQANQSLPVAVAGEYLWIQNTTQAIAVSVNDGVAFTCPAGPVLNLGTFTSLVFTNNTASAITLTFWYGSAAMIAFANGASKDAPTVGKGTYSAAIANNGTVNVPGNTGGLQRRQIIISNADANNTLVITDAAANPFDLIPPGQTHTYDTNSTLILSATKGAISLAVVGEIYYTT